MISKPGVYGCVTVVGALSMSLCGRGGESQRRGGVQTAEGGGGGGLLGVFWNSEGLVLSLAELLSGKRLIRALAFGML